MLASKFVNLSSVYKYLCNKLGSLHTTGTSYTNMIWLIITASFQLIFLHLCHLGGGASRLVLYYRRGSSRYLNPFLCNFWPISLCLYSKFVFSISVICCDLQHG